MAFCFLANAVLARETWARQRLEPFAGQGFQIRAPLLAPLHLVIGPGGRIEQGHAQPAAVITASGIAGDSALADELRYLRRHLRPDIEEELSRFVGDIAAQRLVGTARSFLQWQLDALQRIGEAVAQYAVEERGAVVRRPELADFARELDDLNRALERLERRMAGLD